MRLLIALTTLCSLSALAAEPKLTVTRLNDGSYELVLVTDRTTDVAVAQHALIPVAQQICAGNAPRFGRYKFETTESLPGQPAKAPSLTLNQTIHCDAAAAATPKPAPRDEALIERLSKSYWNGKDTGKYAEAHALFSPEMQQMTPLERWTSRSSDFNVRAGAVKERRIKKITWYDNPPGGPPGTYAAVDYASSFENLSFHCGYIVWQVAADGSAQLIREEENSVRKSEAAQMRPDELKAIAQKFRCDI